MPAKPRTSKTVTKNIRFSYSMLEQIEFALKSEKTQIFSMGKRGLSGEVM
ncbi:Uncharacterised protein [Salmonella enterica subsp. diarizonae]|uniref:DUF3950 domain-containing protein n=1 Tax=Salmonella diarizonae TaxID=59204 RepID=A0A379U0R9_SALDZ|nr:Uncharacterised protein [Salmonella enterica subsp. diarizonae]